MENYKKNKIGVGVITYKRSDYFRRTISSLPLKKIDLLIAVNDGTPYEEEAYNNIHHVIQHEKNSGVAVAKNSALKYLLKEGCEHIFILEDDMQILREDCFEKYIEASKESNILHFNYGPGSPFNLKQKVKNFDLHNRHLLDQASEPNPKLTINYTHDIGVVLYEHTVAMFSYFHRSVLEKVGLIDEQFYNAWEHVDHTYQIYKAGHHPPFWWFADVKDSHLLLKPQDGAIDNSSIADKGNKWIENVQKGAELYKNKNGHYPAQTKLENQTFVIDFLKKLKKK